jgi:hypothetical protein
MNKTMKISYVQNKNNVKDAFVVIFNNVASQTIVKICDDAWENAKMNDIATGSHDIFTTDLCISWDGWDEGEETTKTFIDAIIEECKKLDIEVEN